ncbi:MAG TPA: MBL fold metallo-hydrolase [Acetobacteraceae bacterium]|jgi:ribonuclease J|nr:MBL fold metallo-hydrolase [Acetobacteraceae bacterium]
MIDADGVDASIVPLLPRDSFSVCIHRGTQQIGGTCIELSCQGQRILLDLGLPLDAGETDPAALMPPIAGLDTPDSSLLGLVLSHGHADHWGLAPHASVALPIVTGAATRRILRAAAAFVPRAVPFGTESDGSPDLEDRKTIQLGPFAITPYLVDHSAFDAYALLIEANGRRLFYSGDIRAHGRKAALFERLVSHPPRPVHAMLMEGSSLGRLKPDQLFPTESEIEARLVDSLQARGFIGVCASAQNIDRVVSVYRACKRTGRTLVLDLYALEVLAATGSPNIPAPGWPNLAVYVPEYQRRHIARTERFDIVDRYKPYRIYRDKLAGMAARAVMLFRPAMMRDIDLMAGAWIGARMIWSQWDGYLPSDANRVFQAALTERGVPLEVIHTSGHASIADLKRLAEAMAPDALVPVHTFNGDRFADLFGTNVSRRMDGEWWEV